MSKYGMGNFKEYLAQEQLSEVARASLWRSLTKWGAGHPDGRVLKPVAIVTAFRANLVLAQNRQRNQWLLQNMASMGLSYYPVSGSGQEKKRFFLVLKLIVPSNEESFVVQPRGQMDEGVFEHNLLTLINKYEQDCAAVKLPSNPVAFLLFPNGEKSPLGDTAAPRKPDDPFYSELPQGPRTSDSQLSPWELHGERNIFAMLGNKMRGRADLNRAIPADQRGGRRFAIGWKRPKQGDINAQTYSPLDH